MNGLKLFDFLQQFMINTFITHFEKTRSVRKFFILLRNLKTEFHYPKFKVDYIFQDLNIFAVR